MEALEGTSFSTGFAETAPFILSVTFEQFSKPLMQARVAGVVLQPLETVAVASPAIDCARRTASDVPSGRVPHPVAAGDSYVTRRAAEADAESLSPARERSARIPQFPVTHNYGELREAFEVRRLVSRRCLAESVRGDR
jgi:hypothetical protein